MNPEKNTIANQPELKKWYQFTLTEIIACVILFAAVLFLGLPTPFLNPDFILNHITSLSNSEMLWRIAVLLTYTTIFSVFLLKYLRSNDNQSISNASWILVGLFILGFVVLFITSRKPSLMNARNLMLHCRDFHAYQTDFHAKDYDQDGILEYAKQYDLKLSRWSNDTYYGFRVLYKKGNHAKGGAGNYISLNPNTKIEYQTEGYAILIWPKKHADLLGLVIMTGSDKRIYVTNFGPNKEEQIDQIDTYDPDPKIWHDVTDWNK